MNTILLLNVIALWFFVLINLLLILALIRKSKREDKIFQSGLLPGTKAPEFEALTPDGKTVTQPDFLGKKIVLLFISPHCKFCIDKLPEYQILHPSAKIHGVELLLVCINGTLEEMHKLVSEAQISIPILLAPQETNPFSKTYNVNGTPSYCFINEKGLVQSAGYPDDAEGGEWKKIIEDWKES